MNTFNQLYEAITRRNFLKNIGKGIVGSTLSTPADILNVADKLVTASPLNLNSVLLKFINSISATEARSYFKNLSTNSAQLIAALKQNNLDIKFFEPFLKRITIYHNEPGVDMQDLITDFTESGDDFEIIDNILSTLQNNNIPLSNNVLNTLESNFGMGKEYISLLKSKKGSNKEQQTVDNNKTDSIKYSRMDTAGGSEDVQGKDYTTLEQTSFNSLVNRVLQEKKDRCYYKAVRAYGKKTSAYRSAAMVKCRKNKK